MTALAASGYSNRRKGDLVSAAVAAGVHIFYGAIVVREATGYAKPAVAAVGLTGLGLSTQEVDNTGGADGALAVVVERHQWYQFANAGDITIANIGAAGYAVDDQTISSSSSGGTRSSVCTIRDVDSDGVWVSFP